METAEDTGDMTPTDIAFGEISPVDVVAHEHGPGCVCGPAAIPVVAGDGTRGAIVAHRPLIGGYGEPTSRAERPI